MSKKIWLENYPKGVPHEINCDEYLCVRDMVEEKFSVYKDCMAFSNFGCDISFEDVDILSRKFASFLQNHLGLKKGDRLAICMPNLLQYPIAVFGALRIGVVIVNVNPLYTSREMGYQLKDAGVKAILILSNFAHTLEEIVVDISPIEIIVTDVGDMLSFPKSLLINSIVKYVKRDVPRYSLRDAYSFNETLKMGVDGSFDRVDILPDDLAFIQYTGGTTGVSKGAMLTQRNIMSNVFQIVVWMKSYLNEKEEVAVTPLPLCHVFATISCLVMVYFGAKNILITNPRDIPAFVKVLKKNRFSVFAGINTLFNALINNSKFEEVDFSELKITIAGGMALTFNVAEKWEKITGCPISEGYGLTETSPVVCINPIDKPQYGTVGMPVSSTDVRIVDEKGNSVGLGEIGEICVKGPQVMSGYWRTPKETKKVLRDGWFYTGDIGILQRDGFVKIVDRKKDMILVSASNVFPNEIEEVISKHEGVLEVGVVGVRDSKTGEAVKVFVVPKKPDSLTEEEIIEYCTRNLANYKVPKYVEFRESLPKSYIGKILRRELKDENKGEGMSKGHK